MKGTKSLYVADWEIMYKQPNEHHEFFYAENCTENQAWYKFEKKIPREVRGRRLHIVEYRDNPDKYENWEKESEWKHPFKCYPDKAA
tara:strand:+ start:632 stop:892 length:261 start_codon:yes stop_codon:yes gene_type:complete